MLSSGVRTEHTMLFVFRALTGQIQRLYMPEPEYVEKL